jgi:pimeloyl-ACP methyl ester carboxylesterase
VTCISARSLEVTGRRVLAIGGAESGREGPANTMKLVADDVQTLVIPDCGHWLAEQAPEKLLAALTPFLSPTETTRPRSTRP